MSKVLIAHTLRAWSIYPFFRINSIPAIFRQSQGMPTILQIQEIQPICYLRKPAAKKQRASCWLDHYILPSVVPSGRYTNSQLTSKIMTDHCPRSLGVHLFCMYITYNTTRPAVRLPTNYSQPSLFICIIAIYPVIL